MSAILSKTKIKQKNKKQRLYKVKTALWKTNNKIKTYQNPKPLVWLIKREKNQAKIILVKTDKKQYI